jgi:hypothetical protein
MPKLTDELLIEAGWTEEDRGNPTMFGAAIAVSRYAFDTKHLLQRLIGLKNGTIRVEHGLVFETMTIPGI